MVCRKALVAVRNDRQTHTVKLYASECVLLFKGRQLYREKLAIISIEVITKND